MKKKLTSVLLTVAMVVSLLPAMGGTARAANNYLELGSSSQSGTGWTWNGSTLTLSGATIDQCVWIKTSPATIVLADGTVNTIRGGQYGSSGSNYYYSGIVVGTPVSGGAQNVESNGALTIQGNGILNIAPTTSSSFYTAFAINCYYLTVGSGSDNPTLTMALPPATFHSYGVQAYNGMTINSGTIDLECGNFSDTYNAYASGLFVRKGNLAISKGSLTIKVTGGSQSCYGLRTLSGNLTISGGIFDIIVSGSYSGARDVYASGTATISGGTLKVRNTNNTTAVAADTLNYEGALQNCSKSGNSIVLTSTSVQGVIGTQNHYKIKLTSSGNGYAETSHQTAVTGTPVTLTASPNSGYQLKEWQVVSGGVTVTKNGNTGTFTMGSGDVEIKAVFEIVTIATYTVSYNANGGSGAPSSQTKTHDVNLTLSSTTPTRSGYTFFGWATSSSATTAAYQPGGSYTANSGTTLYAVWRENTKILNAPAAISLTYDGSAQELVSAGAASNGTMYYKLSTESDYATNIPKAANAGTYTVNYYAKTTNGTVDTSVGSISVTISKATPSYTAPTGLTATYGDTLSSVQLTGGWTWNNGASSVGNAGTNSFPATFTPSDTANYNTVSMDLVVAVSAKTVSAPTIELSQSSYVYDGTAKTPAVTVKDGGTVIPASEYTVSYSSNTEVGTATVTVTNNAGGNYTVSGSTTFSIALKPLSLTANINGWTYGGTANAPTLTGNVENGTVTWEYTVKDANDYSTTVPTAAGEYTVRASVAQTANYAAGTATADFTIAKAALTVTAKPHTIVKGDAPANDGVTYSGFVNDEDESVLGGTLSYSYNTDGSTAGVFAITPSGLTSGNYAISFIPGALTVKDTYAVTYYRNYAADDGEITETQRKVEDTALTLSLPAAARTGYTLDGWFSARSGGARRTEANYTDNAALDLYAQWTPNAYTVRFNANGGTGEMDDMAFTYDEEQPLTANAFTRSAYNFVGWAVVSDGSVEWNNGATVRNLTADVDGTVTLYAIWTPKPVYRVSGTVVGSDHTTLSGVVVKLMRGSEEIASAITAANGLYVFDAPVDIYNIVATWQKDADTEVTKTQLVVLNANKSYELVMPNGKTNSVLELKGDDTPPIVVGGLDNEAAAVKTAEGDDIADAKNVTVTMTVESKDEDEVSTDATAIKTIASGRTLEYLAISVEKDVDGETSEMSTTANVLEIVVPYDFTGKQTVEVYRYHDTDAKAMTALDAQPDDENPAVDGTFWLDKDTGLIYIYTQNFSTYAIGYTVSPAPTPAPSIAGGRWTPTAPLLYPVDFGKSEHGTTEISHKETTSGTKVIITPKPDVGYETGSVIVRDNDGKIIPVTKGNDGRWSFTMPASKVTVEVSYTAITQLSCPQDDTCPISAFSDANPKAWYHDGVHYVLKNGIMSGYGNGLFGPNDTTTRAMMAQILWNMEGKPVVNYAMSYTDVDGEAWYTEAVRWVTAEGIMSGYGGGLFEPNDVITREQLAAIVHRYAKYKGADVSIGEDTNILSYDDAFDISEWAISAMQWAVGSGAVNGKTETTLAPQDSASRAEIATIIMRYCTEIAK